MREPCTRVPSLPFRRSLPGTPPAPSPTISSRPSGTRSGIPLPSSSWRGRRTWRFSPWCSRRLSAVIILYGQPKEGVVLREVDAAGEGPCRRLRRPVRARGERHCTRERPHPLNKFGADVWRIPMTPMADLRSQTTGGTSSSNGGNSPSPSAMPEARLHGAR